MSEPTGSSEPRPLRGWKEVATHLGTSTRSAQRYADELSLPVHRRGTKGAPVVAFPAELDDWLRRQSPSTLDAPANDVRAPAETFHGNSTPARLHGRRLAQILAVVLALGAIGAWAAWRTPSTSPAVVPTDPNVITLGVRIGESQSPTFFTSKSGGASMVGFKSGERLWIVPSRDGDRVRLTLYDSPEGTPNRQWVGKGSIPQSQGDDVRLVSFQFDYATLHIWWAQGLPKSRLD